MQRREGQVLEHTQSVQRHFADLEGETPMLTQRSPKVDENEPVAMATTALLGSAHAAWSFGADTMEENEGAFSRALCNELQCSVCLDTFHNAVIAVRVHPSPKALSRASARVPPRL